MLSKNLHFVLNILNVSFCKRVCMLTVAGMYSSAI